MGNYDGFGTYNFGGGGGGGGTSAGTSNEFQITDNAGGFLASLIQQDSDNIIPTTTAGVGGAGTKLGSATNYYAKLYLGGETANTTPADCPTIYVQADCDFFIQKAGTTSSLNSLLWISRTTNGYVTSDRSFQTRNNGTQHFRIGNSGNMIFGASGSDKNYIQNTYTKFGFWNSGTGAVLKVKSTFTGADFDASALLNLISTTQGFMQPSMTVAQRTAIASPIAGLQVHTEDGTDSIPYYNHSVDGWIPVGRYANKGATVNGGIAPTANQYLVSSNTDGEINYSPFRWSVSGVTPYLYGVRTDTNAVSSANLGASSTSVRWLNLYFRGTLNHQYGNLTWTTGTNAGMSIKSTGDLRIGFTGTGSQAGMILRDDAVETYDIDASAMIELRSTTRGFLPPKMTTVEMNAIATPATGLMIYDTTTNQWMGYDGTSWVIIG